MVLIQLVKINTFKVNWNLSYSIIKYKNKTVGEISTMLVSTVIRGEDPSCLRVAPRRITAMEMAANEIQNIWGMSWLSIKIINVIINSYVNISLGVKIFSSNIEHLNSWRISMRGERPWALSQYFLCDTIWRARKQQNIYLLHNKK